MKKILTLFFLFCLAFLNAQYTITPTQKPEIGDTHSFIYLDTTNIINGSSGVNQVWDFSNLTLPNSPSINSLYYSPLTAISNYTWYP